METGVWLSSEQDFSDGLLETDLQKQWAHLITWALESQNNAEVTVHNYGSRAPFRVTDILEAMAKDITANALVAFVDPVVHGILSSFA